MMTVTFREKLKEKGRLLGTLISLRTSVVPETLSRIGFDWLWLDMEHGPLEISDVLQQLQSMDSSCFSLVRVPANEPTWLKRVLDLGPDGVIVPHVSCAEDARRAVSACKYPPAGTRSAGPGRAQQYGLDSNYVGRANDVVSAVVQIEHKDAVRNLNEIIAVEGVDATIIGSYDLSGSMGKFGKFDDPEVKQAIVSVRETCSRAGIPCGIFTMSPAMAKQFFDDGFQLVCCGTDANFLWSSAKATIEAISGA